MGEKEALQAVLKGKCPRCRSGAMFTHSPAKLSKFGEMNEQCAHCGFRFEREPGFFYGAMYVSYALSVGIFLVASVILYFLFGNPNIEVYVVTVALLALLSYPLNFRYSRILFLHVFGGVKYDPSL